MPGTASVEEAEQNALSGHAPVALDHAVQAELTAVVGDLSRTVCSRCGACDTLCSQNLAISSIFWAGLFHLHPSGVLEQPDNIEYFRQHGPLESVCATCPDVTCVCPAGIDIPASLITMHSRMVGLMQDGIVPPPAGHATANSWRRGLRRARRQHGHPESHGSGPHVHVPPATGERRCARMAARAIPSTGRAWRWGSSWMARRTQTLEVTQDVHRGSRWQFLFEVTPPAARAPLRPAPAVARRAPGFLRTPWPHRGLRGDHGVWWRDQRGNRAPWGFCNDGHSTERRQRPCGPGASAVRCEGFAARALTRTPAPIAAAGPPVPTTGSEAPPPATVRPYAVAWLDHNLPTSFRKGETLQGYLRVVNEGSRHWHASHPEGRWVELVVYLGEDAAADDEAAQGRAARGGSPAHESRSRFRLSADAGKWTVTRVVRRAATSPGFTTAGWTPLVVDVRAEEPAQGALADA